MEITIKEKIENPLLKRTEVKGEFTFEGKTPSNNDFTVALAKKLPGIVLVKHIYTKFSHQKGIFTALSYQDQSAMDSVEIMTKHLRKKAEEKKKSDAAAKTEQETAVDKVAKVEKTSEKSAPEEA